MIQETRLDHATTARSTAGLHFRMRPGAIGGYVILVLLSLIYLIPLLFVFGVSLMESRQFNLNAGVVPQPDHVVELPGRLGQGQLQHLLRQLGALHHGHRVRDAGLRHARGVPDRAQPRPWEQRLLPALPLWHLAAGLASSRSSSSCSSLACTTRASVTCCCGSAGCRCRSSSSPASSRPSRRSLTTQRRWTDAGYLRYIVQIIGLLLQPGLGGHRADRRHPCLERHHRSGDISARQSRSSRSRRGPAAVLRRVRGPVRTLIAAAIGITALPLILLYIFTQRYIIAGMTSGALKG